MGDRYIEYGVVIPAFNAAGSVREVVEGTSEYIDKGKIVVVDDGSEDETAMEAQNGGALVIRHEKNRGKGSALITGFNHFISIPGVKGVFTIDADGQHDPSEIPLFIDLFESEGVDIIVGNRMDDVGKMPLLRRFTNRVTSAVISLIAGCRIDDSQSGYRLISIELLRKIKFVTSRYDTESELLIKAGRMGARIASVPIKAIYADEVSSINPFSDTMRFLALVFRSFFW